MTPHPSNPNSAGPVTPGPALPGSDDEALIQALRNLWPLLNKPSRTTAIRIVNTIRKG